jgi:Zn-dependent protease
MAFGGYGAGAGGSGRPRRRNPPNQRTIIIVGIGLVIFVYLIRTHHISSDELIYFCVLIPSIILHEISHGVVALFFGDDTAKRNGRLTLNPVKHIDPVGTILVPAVLSLSGLGAYGWAKPVPVNPNRLRHPRNETVLVSLVGPLTNYLLAALMGLVFVLITPQATRELLQSPFGVQLGLPSQIFLIAGFANIVLGTFNLIPCPPLDGAAVLERLIPARSLGRYYELQPMLMFLPFILILVFHNQWSELISHVINWWEGLLV